MTLTRQTWITMMAASSVAALLAVSCQADDGSDPSEIFQACHQTEVHHCNQATGKNEGFEGGCSGDVLATCPTEDLVGSCLLNEAEKDEVTIYYYEGSMDDGRTDCEVQQQVQGGVYTAID